jgi:hypothetical protein
VTRAANTLCLLREAFPGRDRLVEQAYRDNRVFRELCDDYRRCRAALDSWQQQEVEGTEKRAREYTELLAELAAEIEIWLQAMGTGSYGPQDGAP